MKHLQRCILTLLILCLAPFALGENAVQVELHQLPVNIAPSDICKVSVAGESLTVMDTRVNHTRVWTSRPMTDVTPVAFFSTTGAASIVVEYLDETITEAIVRPLHLNITPVIQDNKIFFVLPSAQDVVLEINGEVKKALHLFVSDINTNIPNKDDVLWYGPGMHNTGIVTLESNQTVYLAPGCVIRGAFHAADSENITILGRGIIDGSKFDRWEDTIVPIDFRNCKNVRIEGITLLDASAWNVNLYHCDGIAIDGVNILAARSNSDGFTLQSCKNAIIQNVFVRGWDDNLVVKGYDGDVSDITFQNCVLWTDLAQSCEIGYETRAESIKNVNFQDITVLHNFHKPVLSIHNSDSALVDNVLFKNIVVEDAQMGEGDGSNLLIELTTTKSQWSETKTRGVIRNVVFDGVTVLSGKDTAIRLMGFSKDCNIDNVTFQNIQVLGKRITSMEDWRVNKNNRLGENIGFILSDTTVTQNRQGYLHTYKEQTPAIAASQYPFTLSATGSNQAYGAGNAGDGNTSSYWEGKPGAANQLTLTFAPPCTPEKLIICLPPSPVWEKRTQSITISTSADGADFIEALPQSDYIFDPNTENKVEILLPTQEVTAIRLTFHSNTAATAGQVAEIYVE